MWDVLKNILVTKLKVADDTVTPDTPREQTDLDSLGIVELSMVLDKEHGIGIREDELAAARSLKDISDLMEQRSART
ncbi:acyl carrier protein [Streptomyces sp. NPDC050095]|uniref:acyl carrier protein n=1 Tax=unclassified Streptomyces TaxID=2593676 RepID=UPI0034382D08